MKNNSDFSFKIAIGVLTAVMIGGAAMFVSGSLSHKKISIESSTATAATTRTASKLSSSSAMSTAATLQPASRETEQALREEYKKTGETPKALLNFGSDLGRSMLEAFKSEEAAETVFGNLQKCTENVSAAEPFRAMCAANAKRLTIKFPDRFGQRFAQLERELPANFRSFLEAVTN